MSSKTMRHCERYAEDGWHRYPGVADRLSHPSERPIFQRFVFVGRILRDLRRRHERHVDARAWPTTFVDFTQYAEDAALAICNTIGASNGPAGEPADFSFRGGRILGIDYRWLAIAVRDAPCIASSLQSAPRQWHIFVRGNHLKGSTDGLAG